MSGSDDSDPVTDKNRQRLMRGFAEVIEDKGYSATTVLDIVRKTGVSKRTFYEHFSDKERCLVACYLDGSVFLLNAMTTALEPETSWKDQVKKLVSSYLAALQTHPVMTRTVFIEIQAASSRILNERKRVNQSFVDALQNFSNHLARRFQNLKPLSPQAALILVGGINEMVLFAAEDKAINQLSQMETGIVDMIADLLSKNKHADDPSSGPPCQAQ